MSGMPCRGRSRLWCAVLLAAVLLGVVRAEKVFSSPEELRARATHVVTGTVESVSAARELEGAWEYVRYRAVVRVGALEKGSGLAAGDTFECRYWTKSWLAPTPPPPDTSGHSPLPRRGQSVRVFVVNAGYNGFGTTTDGGYDVFGRNGWEILSPATAGDEAPAYDELDADWRRVLVAGVFVAAVGALFLALVWSYRKRKRKHA
jgi:hypothetical protein